MATINVPVLFPAESTNSVTINNLNPRVVRLDMTGFSGTLTAPVDLILSSSTMIQASTSFAFVLDIGGTTVASVNGWGSSSSIGIKKTFSIPAATLQPYVGSIVDLNFTTTFTGNTAVGTDQHTNINVKPSATATYTPNQNGGYTAQLSTGTATMPNPVVKAGKSKTVNATVLTGSALALDPTVAGEKFDLVSLPFVDDANLRSNGGVTDIGRADAPVFRDGTNSDKYLIKVNLGNYSSRTFQDAVLRVGMSTTGVNQIDVYDVSNSWSDATGNATGIAQSGSPVMRLVVPAHAANSYVDIPMDKDWMKTATGVHSLMLVGVNGTGTATFITMNGASLNSPEVRYRLVPVAPTGVTVNAEAMTATAAMGVATVTAETRISVTVNAETALSNGSLPAPTVSTTTEPNATFNAEAATGVAQAIDPVVLAGNSVVINVADLGEGDGEMMNAAFSDATSVNYPAQYMISVGRIITPKVNGFDVGYYDDPYYVLTQAQTDADDLWYRFMEETGALVVKDEKTGLNGTDAQNGQVFGGPSIGFGLGPHRSMAFDGLDDYINVPTPTTQTNGFYQGSLEFYIKTDVKNQVVMLGYGDLNTGQSQFAGLPRDSEVTLVNGRIRITNNVYRQGSLVPTVLTFDGFKDIADGQWHQVVLTNWWYEGTGISIYVDGKLDRRSSDRVMLVGRPDTIGRIGGQFFRGELSEIVHRTFSSVSKYIIEQAYYAFFGFNPIRPEIMTASGEMPRARGRGNATKILALHHRFSPQVGGGINPSLQDSQGLDTQWANAPKVDAGVPIAKYGNIYPPFAGTSMDINSSIDMFPGAKMYFQSIFYKNAQVLVENTFRDEVTDEPRAIDLMKDVDLDDFDAIYLVDWPGVDYFKVQMQYRNYLKIYDDFVESLKAAVFDHGINLYVVSPDVAKALGLVDDYEAKKVHWDSAPANTGYSASYNDPLAVIKTDYRGAYNNPFVNPEALAGRESDLRDELARRIGNPRNAVESMMNYYDTHRNNHHRFAVSIPEFTDIPGAFLTESLWYRQDVVDYDKRAEISYRYLERANGALPGDEVIIPGPLGENASTFSRPGGNPSQVQYNLISFRPEAINVGLAVTKESAWLDNGTTRVANPTAENATIILVPAGSELDGRVINGRIVINPNDNAVYTEEDMYTHFMDLDDNSWENVFKPKENDISKAWQWSTHRLTRGRVEVETQTTSVITGKNGATAVLVTSGKRAMIESGTARTKVVRAVGTAERSWNWLIQPDDQLEEGEVRIKPATMIGSAQAMTPGVGAVSNRVIVATTALGTATMVRPLEDTAGDVKVITMPATAQGQMISPTRKIVVEPMTARAEMLNPVGLEDYNTEDVIQLRLSNVKQIIFRRRGDN